MTTPPPVFQPPSKSPASNTRLYFIIGGAVMLGLIVMVGIVLGAVGMAAKRSRDKQAMANLQQEAQRIKDDFKPGEDLTDPANAHKADQAIDRLANAAGSVDERMKVMVRTVMEEMVSIGKDASACTNRVMAAGGIDPATITSRESATQRIALLQQEKGVAQNTLNRVKGINQIARDAASKSGLSTKEAESFIRGMNGKGQIDRLTRIRELDIELFTLFISTVTLLRDNYGSWTMENEQVTFAQATSGLTERFNDLASKIGDLSTEQEKLMQEIAQSR